MKNFSLSSEYKPSSDQRKAIDFLCEGVRQEKKDQVLLGVTGSGKTFTMANVIQEMNRPTLIMTHNKTLTAQLYGEFKEYFPDNAVEYFVSYYDYYQPEAYVPSSDLFIDKETAINDDLDKMRLSATRSLFEREDVIIVSSVSCIYGLGSPEVYSDMMLYLMSGVRMSREEILKKLVGIRYARNDIDFHRGTFRVRGDTIDIFPAYSDLAVRVEMFGDEIESLSEIDPLTGKKLGLLQKYALYPASHYVMPQDMMPKTLEMIREELEERLEILKKANRLLEAQRLEQRTHFDLELLEETGVCPGIENYSRIMTRRSSGEPPPTLIDYFPKNSLLFLDESHVTLPQIGGMYKGDFSRKKNLIEYGFRLPSAADNRPLTFNEFEKIVQRVIYVSATPGDNEVEKSQGAVIEQIIRPTGLLDPKIHIRPIDGQVDDMMAEIHERILKKEKILITTLTKRMSEDLTEYYQDLGIRIRYLHSEIDTIERTEIIRNLRLDMFDVLVGVNLLREGLDIPEVSLIGIFDADKEGFLRSRRALLQTCGRAARNSNGMVIMYADRITDSIRQTLEETRRRRKIQEEHNVLHQITPTTIKKKVQSPLIYSPQAVDELGFFAAEPSTAYGKPKKNEDFMKKIERLEKEMFISAKRLDFEQAAKIRDEIRYWKNVDLGIME